MTAAGESYRPDPGMPGSSVMRDLLSQAMDDGYTLAAARRDPGSPKDRRWTYAMVVALVALGLLMTVAAIQTRRSAPAEEAEKAQLVERIHAATSRLDELRTRAAAIEQDNNRLQKQALGGTTAGKAIQARLDALSPMVGTSPVTGPGVRIQLDDASSGGDVANAGDDRGRILDIDLQQAVNGLWAAGAEAVSINGQRLTSTSAIRAADRAITVNYRPLARPYTIEAIGNPDTLEARFTESPGGEWLSNLEAGQHIPLSISTVDKLALPADSGIHMRFATTEGQ